LAKMFEGDASLTPVYTDRLNNDKSFMVIGSALKALGAVDKKAALAEAKKLENEKSGDILATIAEMYAEDGGAQYYEFFTKAYPKVTSAMGKYGFITQFGNYIIKQDDDAVIDKGIAFAENTIKNENAWWLKLAAYSMLNGIAGHYIEQLDKMKTAGASEADMRKVEDRKDKVVGIFRDYYKNEKDPNVLKYLGGEE